MIRPVFVLFLGVFPSCTSKEIKGEEQLVFDVYETQEWRLVKMTGSIPNSETTGDAMEWQETYIFRDDLTFSKTRVWGERTTTASGRFTVQENDVEIGMFLVFENNFELVGNCQLQNEEYLYFTEDKKTLLSGWWACDGPGLFYQRTN
ncbi:MAG: hypothetical protein AAGH81_08265 [Bacteroidota bacterium]